MRIARGTRTGVTLVELIVVLAIITLLLGLLIPAVHFSRESARWVACQGNLHQLGIALTHLVDARKKLPSPALDGTIGGWAIAILPFMEDTALAEGLAGSPPLDASEPLALARKQPPVMRCPSAWDGDSSLAAVAASHYSAVFNRHTKPDRNEWQIGELPTDSRIPWVVSPEVPFGGPAALMPHGGGFNVIAGHGSTAEAVLFSPGK
jgi:prepilin-type N-terminal cleavage/methylation domain-containing protein